MRVLVAASNPGLCAELVCSLRQWGHAADHVCSEGEALAALRCASFEMLVVDLGVSTGSGSGLVKRLRACFPSLPLLALAATSDPRERIAALDGGSDDCVGSPVVVAEVMARVRAWVRRGMGSASHSVWHGPLRFDTAERSVHLDGKQVLLSHRELSILEILIKRRGRYVSKDSLAAMMFAWGEDVATNSIEVYVHRLRKKIEVGPVRIVSSRGLGYQLERIASQES